MLANDKIKFLAQSNEDAVRRIEYSLENRKYKGGDPCNGFRELRRLLISRGIDTRVFSFGTIPVPNQVHAIDTENVFIREDTTDNSFFFELRKMIDTDTGLKVNVLVLLFRVFFVGHQSSDSFVVQSILNHHRDSIYQLSQPYNETIYFLEGRQWSQPREDISHNKISFFEKNFNDVYAFTHEFDEMLALLKGMGVVPNLANPTPAGF
jgi:hypothetical protein